MRFVIQRRDTGAFAVSPHYVHNWHQWSWVDGIDEATLWTWYDLPGGYCVNDGVVRLNDLSKPMDDVLQHSFETRRREVKEWALKEKGVIP